MRKTKMKSASKSKRGSKKAIVSVRRKSRKMKTAPARKRKAFDSQMGRVTGRDASALTRRDELIQDYIRDGMEPSEACQRAIAVMRDNPKKDWRRG
jgi:hypothetical protein